MFGIKTRQWAKHYKESADEIRKDFFEYTDLLISVNDNNSLTAEQKVAEMRFILEERECRILRYDPMTTFMTLQFLRKK